MRTAPTSKQAQAQAPAKLSPQSTAARTIWSSYTRPPKNPPMYSIRPTTRRLCSGGILGLADPLTNLHLSFASEQTEERRTHFFHTLLLSNGEFDASTASLQNLLNMTCQTKMKGCVMRFVASPPCRHSHCSPSHCLLQTGRIHNSFADAKFRLFACWFTVSCGAANTLRTLKTSL